MIKTYFNSKADIWDEEVAEKDTAKLSGMAARLDIRPGDAVLDVGTGTGTGVFVPYLLGKIGSEGRLVCLDVADKMLSKARAKSFQGNIEYICADVSDTHLGNAVFEAVVCYSSFPHFLDKAVALREISRMLKKGGRLFICHTSSRTEINDVHRQIPEVSADIIPDSEEMERLLSSAGFGDISLDDGADSYLVAAIKL